MKLLLAALFAIGLASLPVAAGRRLQLRAGYASGGGRAGRCGLRRHGVSEQPVGAETGPVGAMAATLPVPAPFGQIVYTFAVDGVAKGDVGSRVDVLGGGDGASCGMSFGSTSAGWSSPTWDGAIHSTGLCSGNVLLEKGAEATVAADAHRPATTRAPATAEIPVDGRSRCWASIGAVAAVSWLAFRRGSSRAAS